MNPPDLPPPTATEAHFPPEIPDGPIGFDLPCRRCSYNLRGLLAVGLCPECGTPVGRSLQGDLLRFADPNWVERLARGGRLVMIGLTLVVLGMFIFSALIGALAAMAGPAAAPMGWILIGSLLSLAPWLVLLFGVWLITTPDPSGLGEDRYARSRRMVRAGVLASLASVVFDLIIPDQGLPAGATGGTAFVVTIALAVLGLGLSLVTTIGGLAYIRFLSRLVDRVPDPGLTRFGGRVYTLAIIAAVLWLLTIGLGVVAVFLIGPGAAPTGGFLVALSAVGCGAGLLGLIGFLIFARFQHRCGKAFTAQARIARETWAGGVQPLGT
jgi:hypothetical protein